MELSGAPKKLKRSHSINGGALTETIVAQHIVPGVSQTNCEFAGGGAFSLPDENDAFRITDLSGGDSGTITITAGSVTVTHTGTATVAGGSEDEVTITPAEGAVAWTTPSAGDSILVTADLASTMGAWTNTAASATATITGDIDGDITIATGSMLIFTVTATVEVGSQEESETRVYKIVPKPGL